MDSTRPAAATSNGAEADGRDRVEIDPDVPLIQDEQTVTPEGERLSRFIDGVQLRSAVIHPDERGTITEIFNPAWGFTDQPVVYVYESAIYPGQKKGWIVHLEQDDRLFFSNGAAKVVLYDARRSSPTKGLVQELFLGEVNRGLLLIPAGVFHAVVNIGQVPARFVNMPTRPYRHERPDKYRLTHDTVHIPYEL